jgi:hypothetical protein
MSKQLIGSFIDRESDTIPTNLPIDLAELAQTIFSHCAQPDRMGARL